MALRDWKRQKPDISRTRIVYTNPSRNIWLGVAKNADGTWNVLTPMGMQRQPFPNKRQALSFAKAYMRMKEVV